MNMHHLSDNHFITSSTNLSLSDPSTSPPLYPLALLSFSSSFPLIPHIDLLLRFLSDSFDTPQLANFPSGQLADSHSGRSFTLP